VIVAGKSQPEFGNDAAIPVAPLMDDRASNGFNRHLNLSRVGVF